MKLNELNKKREQYQTEGNILKEIEILRVLLNETEKQYGLESDEYIKALNELGGTLKYVGYYDEAEANLLKSLEIIKKKYGDNNLPQLITHSLMQDYVITLDYIIKMLVI